MRKARFTQYRIVLTREQVEAMNGWSQGKEMTLRDEGGYLLGFVITAADNVRLANHDRLLRDLQERKDAFDKLRQEKERIGDQVLKQGGEIDKLKLTRDEQGTTIDRLKREQESAEEGHENYRIDAEHKIERKEKVIIRLNAEAVEYRASARYRIDKLREELEAKTRKVIALQKANDEQGKAIVQMEHERITLQGNLNAAGRRIKDLYADMVELIRKVPEPILRQHITVGNKVGEDMTALIGSETKGKDHGMEEPTTKQLAFIGSTGIDQRQASRLAELGQGEIMRLTMSDFTKAYAINGATLEEILSKLARYEKQDGQITKMAARIADLEKAHHEIAMDGAVLIEEKQEGEDTPELPDQRMEGTKVYDNRTTMDDGYCIGDYESEEDRLTSFMIIANPGDIYFDHFTHRNWMYHGGGLAFPVLYHKSKIAPTEVRLDAEAIDMDPMVDCEGYPQADRDSTLDYNDVAEDSLAIMANALDLIATTQKETTALLKAIMTPPKIVGVDLAGEPDWSVAHITPTPETELGLLREGVTQLSHIAGAVQTLVELQKIVRVEIKGTGTAGPWVDDHRYGAATKASPTAADMGLVPDEDEETKHLRDLGLTP